MLSINDLEIINEEAKLEQLKNNLINVPTMFFTSASKIESSMSIEMKMGHP
jgi:hypothetical protein